MEAQTSPSIEEDPCLSEKLIFRLPSLEEEIRALRIDIDCQTDLQMDHFSSDDSEGTSKSRNNRSNANVVVIYRNPSMASFLGPYLLGVGGVALGCFAVYAVAKFIVTSLRIGAPVSPAQTAA